jgi:type IV secretory pathway TraG/TraD family ATPase VirD4
MLYYSVKRSPLFFHLTFVITKERCGADRSIHINTAENFLSIIKRGLVGVYQHWSKQHLHRYLTEFDFRYGLRFVEDEERAVNMIKQVCGKRLRYNNN